MPLSERAAALRGTKELRSFAEPIELRAADDGDITFEGVASSVEKPYLVRDFLGEFTETIRDGAFDKTLKDRKSDIELFVNHDTNGVPLATRSSKTLTLDANPDLAVVASLDAARSDVQILRSAISRGQMAKMSIGFQAVKQEWSPDYSERSITEVKLFEVSVVNRPANPHTSAAVRSLDELIHEITSGSYDEPQLRRAIAHLESLLPAEETAEARTEEDPDVAYRLLMDLWAKRAA